MDSFIKEAKTDGRLHLSTNPMGTVTGRPSSEGLMNIPREKKIKSLFIAPAGYKLVSADLSQAEVRCFAHYAKEQVLRNAFAVEGIDVHCMVAAEVNGIPFEQFMTEYNAGSPRYKAMRQAAKGTVFGLLYGRGPRSIAEEYGMTLEEATAFMNSFFGKFPNCKKWIDETHTLVHNTGQVVNLFGRIRRIPAIFSLTKLIWKLLSNVQIPSCAVSMMFRYFLSLLRSATSACLRSVMSVNMAKEPENVPLES